MNAVLLLNLSLLGSLLLISAERANAALPIQSQVWSSGNFATRDLPCKLPETPAQLNLKERRTPDNAYLMMAASHLAYRFWPGRRERILKEWGFSHFEFIDNSRTSTNGFWAEHHNFVLLVFRGTQEPTDLLTDLDVNLEPIPNQWTLKGRVHRGFLSASRSVEKDVMSAANFARSKGKPLILAGHSLGGAIAVLSAIALEKTNHQIHSVWTFGSPKIGDSIFTRESRQLLNEKWQVLNHPLDPIPLLPFAQHEQNTLSQLAQRFGSFVPLIDTFAANAAYSAIESAASPGQGPFLTEVPVSTLARGFWKHLPRSYVCDLSDRSLALR